MSVSFWISLSVCIGSLAEAFWDHDEVIAEYRASTGKQRRRKRLRLLVLWGVPILASFATLATAWESVLADRKLTQHETALSDTSNRLSKTESNLTATEKQLEETSKKASDLEQKSRPRTISESQKAELSTLLKDAPKGRVIVQVNSIDPEAYAFAKQIKGVLDSLGFSVKLDTAMIRTDGSRLGLFMRVKSGASYPPHVEAIIKAFEQIGIRPTAKTEKPSLDPDVLLIDVRPKAP